MTKKWFGPVDCPSGCCYEPPPPPPPPPCACDDTECFPVDELNFSSVKLEVTLSDEFTMIAQVKTLRCTETCRNMYQVEEREYSFSGLSALNGTYDIPYYVYDDYTESWIEGDPLAIPCGVWFYPTIAVTLTETTVVRRYAIPADIYSLYDSSTCIDSEVTTTQETTFYLETRSGLIWTDELALGTSFFYGVCGLCGFNSTWPALSPPVLQRQIDGSVFACSTYGEPAIDETYNVDATIPECNSPLFNLICMPYGLGNNFGEDRAVGVGYNLALTKEQEPRRSSGYPWGDYPYGGPGIPLTSTQCKLDIEEYDDQISATSTDISYSGGPVYCPDFWWIPPPAPGTRGTIIYHFEHTAFSQVIRSIVNAP